jgi:hypothetical protein
MHWAKTTSRVCCRVHSALVIAETSTPSRQAQPELLHLPLSRCSLSLSEPAHQLATYAPLPPESRSERRKERRVPGHARAHSGCSFGRTRASSSRLALNDAQLSPYATMLQVDREQVCLTEIDSDSEVEVVNVSYEGEEADVVLYLRSDRATRSVAFAWEDGEYVWTALSIIRDWEAERTTAEDD